MDDDIQCVNTHGYIGDYGKVKGLHVHWAVFISNLKISFAQVQWMEPIFIPFVPKSHCISDLYNPLFSFSCHQNDFVVETSLVGTVFNGLSHLSAVAERGQFIVGLLRGLGGNLSFKTRQEFAKEVWTQYFFILFFLLLLLGQKVTVTV